MLEHFETKERVDVNIIGVVGNWGTADDGYVYNLTYWRQV